MFPFSAPVSFSIKPRDIDERQLVGRSALPVEESDSEEELPEVRKPPIGSLDQAAGMTDLINLTKQQIALAMVEASMGKADAARGEGGLNEERKSLGLERPIWNRQEPASVRPMSVDYNHGRPRPSPVPPSVPPPPRARDFSRFLDASSPLGNIAGRATTVESRRTVSRPPPKTLPPTVSREELARRQGNLLPLIVLRVPAGYR